MPTDAVSDVTQIFSAPKDLDWLAVMPVVVVIVTGILALIIEIIRPKQNNNAILGVSLAGLVVAGYFCIAQMGGMASETFGGMVLRDRFGQVFQLLVVLSTALTLLFSETYLRQKRIAFGEFYPMILWSASGAMLMLSTKNLLMVFLGLEILSISLYVLAGLSRNEAKSEESALKYFLLGAFASGFLLYGIALIYGATGSLHLDAIPVAWEVGSTMVRSLLVMGLGLSLVGLCFKSAFVPFHQWTPDVYQGAPTNVTAFMAACSKIAAIGTLFRFLQAFQPMHEMWMPAMFWIAILTMTVGNLLALVQKDLKRILGYSSVAQAGYLLVAILAHVSSPNEVGFTSLAFYLLAYSLMTIGAFAVISIAVNNGKDFTRIKDLNGLWQRNPLAAIFLVIFMVSLIGMPPTAGFLGKLMIFQDAVVAGLMPLAIVLAVNSVLSIYYYLGIAMAAFVNESDASGAETASTKPSVGVTIASALCALGIFAATFAYSPLRTGLFGSEDGRSNILSAKATPSAPEARIQP